MCGESWWFFVGLNIIPIWCCVLWGTMSQSRNWWLLWELCVYLIVPSYDITTIVKLQCNCTGCARVVGRGMELWWMWCGQHVITVLCRHEFIYVRRGVHLSKSTAGYNCVNHVTSQNSWSRQNMRVLIQYQESVRAVKEQHSWGKCWQRALMLGHIWERGCRCW